jgi:hypothetical protein
MDASQLARTSLFLIGEYRLRPNCHHSDEDKCSDDVWSGTQRVLAGIRLRWMHDAHLDSLRDQSPGDPLVHALAHLSALRGPDPDRICLFCVDEAMAMGDSHFKPFVYSEQSELEPLVGSLKRWRSGVDAKLREGVGDVDDNGPRCPHCKVGRLRVSLVQIRGGDEPMTERYECTKCNVQRYRN